jgi:ABC-2 type transport system permease protein
VFRRELRGYFGTPVAYVFLVVFLWLSAHLAWANNLYEARDANLRVFFAGMPILFALLAPAIAMRMWAEERRSGTIELLFTLPITTRQAVLGKFAAGWMFFLIALLLSMGIVLAVAFLGDPDNGPIWTGYLGAALMAGAYLAIGTFFSVLTKNQAIAFVLGAITCLGLVFAGSPSILAEVLNLNLWVAFLIAAVIMVIVLLVAATALGATRSTSIMLGSAALILGLCSLGAGIMGTEANRIVSDFMASLSFLSNYDVLQRGLVEFRNIFFMLALTAAFLIGSCIMLDERKAG